MKDKYKITEEEINQTILHSPYSLADSPVSQGLKAKQIKKYFYEFIRFFANKINIHLSDLGITLENYEEICQEIEKISDLEEKDIELGNAITNQIKSHNEQDIAHKDIRSKIGTDIKIHNESGVAHGDIRRLIDELCDRLDVAYNMASGRGTVYTFDRALDLLSFLESSSVCKGDMLLVADASEPDFIVFDIDCPLGSSIELDYDLVEDGRLEAGKSYFYQGVRLISTKGTLETNVFAKKEKLKEIENSLQVHIDESLERLSELYGEILKRESSFEQIEETKTEIELKDHTEYNFGTITELSLSFPYLARDIEAIVNFVSRTTPTAIDTPYYFYFSGDDTSGGRFYPASNRLYEINIKKVMGVLTARVGATDLEVIE